MDPDNRAIVAPQPCFTIWLTGLVGAGKSTLARGIATSLRERGHRVEVLDGEEVRRELSRGLGFSKEDRDANVARLAYVADLLARNGVVAIVAAISPYREARAAARSRIGRFVEVYVHCPLDELVRRDPKGLYARALRGEVAAFTGVSDPYEPPETPQVVVQTDRETTSEGVQRILGTLEQLGYLAPSDPAEATILARLHALGYLEPDDWPSPPAQPAGTQSESSPPTTLPASPPPVSPRAAVARLLRAVALRRARQHLPLGNDPRAGELVDRVAEALFRRACGEGGWALDVGGLGPRAFSAEAAEALNAIALGAADQGPPTP